MGIISTSEWLESAANYNEARMVERYLKTRERINTRYQHLFEYTLSEEYLAARASKKPTVLIFWHCGILRSTFSALAGLEPDVTLIKSGKVFPTQSAQLDILLTDESTSGSVIGNARLLKTAISKLRSGMIVATFLDGTNGVSTANVRLFGRSVNPRGSIYSLVRRSNAALFPCVSHWNAKDGRMELLVGPNLQRDSSSASDVVQVSTDWFANHMSNHIEDLTHASLDLLSHSLDEPGSTKAGEHGVLTHSS